MAANVTRTDEFMRGLGIEVYRVGGSVRDEILGRPVKDADYMVRGVSYTSLYGILENAGAGPKALKDRAGRNLGFRLSKRGGVEITLPRKEVSTGPGHSDFNILMDPMLPLTEDAKRRDFTFNALYRCISDGQQPLDIVADPTSRGLYDLQHRLVQTTYPTSFRDDPLRILRALRFVSVLGYDLSSETVEQMREHADAVDGFKASGRLSGTVLDEMDKILMGPDAVKALRIMRDTGVMAALFPELAPMIGHDPGSRYHDMTTDEHTFKALETAVKADAPLRVRWALLFHDAGKPATEWVGDDGRKHYYARKGAMIRIGEYEMVGEDHQVVSERLWRQVAERMNVPKRLREDVATLIREHMVPCTGKVKGSKVRRNRVRLGDEMLRDLHMHRMCDLTGKCNANRQHMINIAQQEFLRRQAEDAGIPKSTKDLEINGRDALELGMRGEWIGGALAVILDDVVSQPTETTLSRKWQLEQLKRAAAHRARLDAAAQRV